MSALQALLLASLIANAALVWGYLGERDEAIAARGDVSAKSQELAGVRGAAQACSTEVGRLSDLADKRLLEASAARREAAARAAGHARRADQILAAPPPVPGDPCASAQVRVDGWLKGRTQP
ncbi:hypothetical protein [Paracidovorax wautersii]|uniref:Bacteriophage Rz lysis protein n=1 Tax=Paracidovorax wautersii TaxID=1177982 RepID=A0A1I2GAL5_9BURK|nr:hypothetical protein [Paracidovorax wautersii]SFF14625.1 hypothetical protein SAMN04489711_11448 [Paracidovorax wautersii]